MAGVETTLSVGPRHCFGFGDSLGRVDRAVEPERCLELLFRLGTPAHGDHLPEVRRRASAAARSDGPSPRNVATQTDAATIVAILPKRDIRGLRTPKG
jgi:hypothetical protein